MFKRLAEAGAPRRDHRRRQGGRRARTGDTVAAALLAAGIDHCRTTPVSGAPRAPYCLMGVCFDCLVTIDGVGSRQACLVPVREGMRSRPSSASARPGDDARHPICASSYDLVVIGGGPAGLAAAALAARAGLSTVLFDENPGVGGQIYRGITSTPVTRPHHPGRGLLGRRGARGRGQGQRRADRERRHGLEPRSAARSSASRSAARRA